jgi:hypothetical protein
LFDRYGNVTLVLKVDPRVVPPKVGYRHAEIIVLGLGSKAPYGTDAGDLLTFDVDYLQHFWSATIG